MLDRDLALLYGVETRVLNQAVRRNIARFPPDFMFALTREEIRDISQIVTCSTLKHARSVSAFTEQGVAMLSSVLRSPRVVQVNIEIMRAFVRLRELIATNKDLARRLDELEKRYDAQFKVMFDAVRATESRESCCASRFTPHALRPAGHRVSRRGREAVVRAAPEGAARSRDEMTCGVGG
jgi:hypothetical protein